MRPLNLQGTVGFDSLPDQLVQKSLQHGFAFNFLCVGETGIGKSTLIESLFNMKFDFKPTTYELKNVELRSNVFEIEEGNVRVKLTIIETAGFGDQLDKDASVRIICDFVNKQYEKYLQEEMKIERRLELINDTRIHVCLYFISPTGHGLKALDVLALKELSKRVNVLPIIAKSDTISKDDLQRFKTKILNELKTNGVEFYRFPVDDETLQEANAKLNTFIPFAVIASSDFVKHNGKLVRARQYPWGIVEVENETHCDFVKLRESLLRLNVEDLRQRTHFYFYEDYRRRRLQEIGLKDGVFVPFYNKLRRELNMNVCKDEIILPKSVLDQYENKEKELTDREKKMTKDYQLKLASIENEESQLQQEIADFYDVKKLYLEGKLKKRK